MKKTFLAGLVIGLFALGMAGMAQAALMVYYDKGSFLTDAGPTAVYDFESDSAIADYSHDGQDSAGWIKYPSYSYSGTSVVAKDFGVFTLYGIVADLYNAYVRENQTTGNNDVYFNTMGNDGCLNLVFDMDVTAFGFDWIAEGNDTSDHSIFSFDGTTWDLGIPGDSGFFGLIEDSGIAAGSVFTFGQNAYNWSGMSFDNVTYSSNAAAPVPEPATMLLLGTGLIGLAGWRKRKKVFRPSISDDPNTCLACRE